MHKVAFASLPLLNIQQQCRAFVSHPKAGLKSIQREQKWEILRGFGESEAKVEAMLMMMVMMMMMMMMVMVMVMVMMLMMMMTTMTD